MKEGGYQKSGTKQPAKRIDLTQDSILKGVWSLAWPVVTASLLHTMVGLVDIKMVGMLGPAPIAAVGMGRQIHMMLTTVLIMLSTGTTALVARYVGEGSPNKASAVLKESITLGVLGCLLILMPAGLMFARGALILLGGAEDVVALGTPYLRILFVGMAFMVFTMLVNASLRGAGDTKTPLVILGLVNILNMVGDYVLIFGIGPFPRMGVNGAAVASVLARAVGAMVGVWGLLSGRFVVRLNLRHRFRMDWTMARRILRIGVPTGLQGVVRNGSRMVLIKVVASTAAGTAAISSYVIGTQVLGISSHIGLALSTATMTMVGQNLGAGRPDRAAQSGWSAAKIAAMAMGMTGAIFFLFAGPIMRAFTDDPSVIQMGRQLLRIVVLAHPSVGVSMALTGGLRGAGDTASPFYYTIICLLFIQVSAAYVLGIAMGWETVGIWIAICVAGTIRGGLMARKFKQGKWKEIVV